MQLASAHWQETGAASQFVIRHFVTLFAANVHLAMESVNSLVSHHLMAKRSPKTDIFLSIYRALFRQANLCKLRRILIG